MKFENILDEQPIGGKGTYNLDDIPLTSTTSNPLEDKPVGGKGGYNLDDLGDGAFPDPNAMVIDMGETKPKKAPPKRLTSKQKPK